MLLDLFILFIEWVYPISTWQSHSPPLMHAHQAGIIPKGFGLGLTGEPATLAT